MSLLLLSHLLAKKMSEISCNSENVFLNLNFITAKLKLAVFKNLYTYMQITRKSPCTHASEI